MYRIREVQGALNEKYIFFVLRIEFVFLQGEGKDSTYKLREGVKKSIFWGTCDRPRRPSTDVASVPHAHQVVTKKNQHRGKKIIKTEKGRQNRSSGANTGLQRRAGASA